MQNRASAANSALDWFYITITPAWFSWLGWVAALSGLQFVAVKTHSAWARLAWNTSNFLIFTYFAALFGRLRIFGVPGIKSDKAIRFVSILVGGLLAWLAAMASIKIAEAFGQGTP